MTDLAARLPLGINTFVWQSPLTDANIESTLRTIAALGYDAVELAFENPGDWDAARAADLLQELGLRSVVGAVFGPGRDLAVASDATIQSTAAYVRSAIDAASRQGSSMVIGPMSTSVGRTWRMSEDERAAAVIELRLALSGLGEYAGDRGVRLALEPLNRYETSFLTTAAQVMEVIEPLPAELVGVNLDTYHMNIEEKTFDDAFATVGDRLIHLQVCGNDRGAPGADHIDWVAVRSSLERHGYEGMLGFESFTADNETIATAASIWRPFAESQDELARLSLAMLTEWRAGWRS